MSYLVNYLNVISIVRTALCKYIFFSVRNIINTYSTFFNCIIDNYIIIFFNTFCSLAAFLNLAIIVSSSSVPLPLSLFSSSRLRWCYENKNCLRKYLLNIKCTNTFYLKNHIPVCFYLLLNIISWSSVIIINILGMFKESALLIISSNSSFVLKKYSLPSCSPSLGFLVVADIDKE